MIKKILCLVLTACLVFSFAACGGSAQEEAEPDTQKTEETGTAGSNIPLKDNAEEAEYQITVAMQKLLVY